MHLPTPVLVQVVRDCLEANPELPSQNLDLMNSIASYVGERVENEGNAYEVAFALARLQRIPQDFAIITASLSVLTFRAKMN